MKKKYIINNSGSTIIIKVNLTTATIKDSKEFSVLLSSIIHNSQSKIIIDLGLCEFLDSTFIGSLIVVSKVAVANEIEIAMVVVKESLVRIFENMNLNRIFNISDNLKNLPLVFNN